MRHESLAGAERADGLSGKAGANVKARPACGAARCIIFSPGYESRHAILKFRRDIPDGAVVRRAHQESSLRSDVPASRGGQCYGELRCCYGGLAEKRCIAARRHRSSWWVSAPAQHIAHVAVGSLHDFAKRTGTHASACHAGWYSCRRAGKLNLPCKGRRPHSNPQYNRLRRWRAPVSYRLERCHIYFKARPGLRLQEPFSQAMTS
jgi:hypothetical protein